MRFSWWRCSVRLVSIKRGAIKAEGQPYRQTHRTDTSARNQQTHKQVAEHPEQHQHRTEVLVRIIQTGRFIFLRFHPRRQGTLYRRLKLAVDIRLRLIHFLDELLLAAVFLLRLCGWQSFGLIGSLRTPGDIMPVAEGIHHQDVDRGRHTEEVGP